MDSFTQLVLGAAIGESVAGKKLGNKAILYGAIAGTLPDLDIFMNAFTNTVAAMNFHRGFTHSIIFAVMFAPLLGLLMKKIYVSAKATWQDWTLLFFLGFITHALLDCFTTWGTQLFWPLEDRIAFKSIFVIDPLYTMPLTICLAWLIFLPRTSVKRRHLNAIGLSLSSAYLLLSLVVKQHINHVFETSFATEKIEMKRYDTRPAPLSILLWTVNVEVKEGYYVGYYSLLDPDQDINYFYFPKRDQLLTPYQENEDVRKLIALTNRWYTLQQDEEGVIFNDLRFGQRTGWLREDGDFVFSYHLYHHGSDVEINEVEKDFSDGEAIMSALWQRICGLK